MAPPTRRWRSSWSVVAVAVGALLGAAVLALVIPAALAYRDVQRVDLDPARFSTRTSPPAVSGGVERDAAGGEEPSSPDLSTGYPGSLASLDEATAVLFIGSDSRSGLEDLTNFGEFRGRRADVILLLVARPGRTPVLLSIPRDLWVEIPCDGRSDRVNEALEGCGEPADGPSVLAAIVDDLTGVAPDHYVEVDLAGFPELIDLVGGVEICTPHPTRDLRSGLELPGGCEQADGEQTLAWIRSRSTEELVDGRWRRVEAVNDLDRNRRQRDLLLTLFEEVRGMRSPSEVVGLAIASAEHLSMDRDLDIVGAAEIVWSMRSLDPSSIVSESVPVRSTSRGEAAVLVPTVDVEEWFAERLSEAPRIALEGDGTASS